MTSRIVIVGVLSLAALLAAIVWISPVRLRHYSAADEQLIKRTRTWRAKFDTRIVGRSYPVVTRVQNMTCVELKPALFSGATAYQACYDPGGKLVEQFAGPVTF